MAAKRFSRATSKVARRRKPTRTGKGAGKSKQKVPPKDALARAQALAERGAVGDALRAAQAVLDAHPDYWQALNFMGAILWHQGHRAEAVAMTERAIAIAPDTADIQAELVVQLVGYTAQVSGNLDRAIAIMNDLIGRHKPLARFLAILVNMLKESGRLADALKTADRAIAMYPANPTLYRNKSGVLVQMGRSEEAVAAYAPSIAPYRPNNKDKKEKTKARGGKIRSQYAGLAPSYDANILNQSFSERMARFLLGIVGTTVNKRILDAGCGTGLLGTHLKAARLVGIDRSPDMLAKARELGLHAELVEGDLVQAMAARADKFDAVASACVLYHIADLAPFFREAARLLVPGGHLLFSVDPAPDTIEIGVTDPGEYAHSRRYLRRLAAETGFAEVAIKIMPHRSHPGFWCAFRRGARSLRKV